VPRFQHLSPMGDSFGEKYDFLENIFWKSRMVRISYAF
jgi:hypothetical protein